MSSPPVVPPRPSRSQATSPPETSAPAPPLIPPRPSRSKSPMPANTEGQDTPSVRFSSTDDAGNSPEQTKVIPSDLELQQPEPVPTGREKERVSRRSMQQMTSKDEDSLPPQIGQRVPLHQSAGDVQAPSPMPGSRARSRSRPRHKKIPVPEGHSDEVIVGDFGAYPSEHHVHRLGGTYSHSAEDLNQSVMQAIKGAGVATTPGLEGVPDEEIGYIASDHYTSRMSTPMNTDGTAGGGKPGTPHVKSPLAKQAFPFDDSADPARADKRKSMDSGDIYIHHNRRTSHEPQASPHHSSTNLSLKGTITPGAPAGWQDDIPEYQDERHEGTPILASDEVNKSTHHLPAAISPRVRSPVASHRPSAINSPNIPPPAEYDDDDVEEDELDEQAKKKKHQPLFPESPKDDIKPRIPPRPSKQRGEHKFPSKDIWEDAPDSHKEVYEMKDAPEKEEAEAEAEDEWIEEPTKKEVPMKKENKDTNSSTSPPTAGGAPPPLPSHRPAARKRTDEAAPKAAEEQPAGKVAPLSSSPEKKPFLPGGPKPVIPARPVRRKESSGEEQAAAGGSDAKAPPPITKPKPMVPPKVGGGIAALRANFMSDLNSRLKLGPVAPKKEEPAEEKDEDPKEKEVLSDARKGRARGPSRRKPTPSAASTEAAAAAVMAAPVAPVSKLTAIFTVWSVNDQGELTCKEAFMTEAAPPAVTKTETEAKEPVPVEKVVAEHEDEMPKEEVDTVKEVLDVQPAPAPPSEPASAVAEKAPALSSPPEEKGAEVIQPPIPIEADKETAAVTSSIPEESAAATKEAVTTPGTSEVKEAEAPKEAVAAEDKPAEAAA